MNLRPAIMLDRDTKADPPRYRVYTNTPEAWGVVWEWVASGALTREGGCVHVPARRLGELAKACERLGLTVGVAD